jgi:hypothetical protein
MMRLRNTDLLPYTVPRVVDPDPDSMGCLDPDSDPDPGSGSKGKKKRKVIKKNYLNTGNNFFIF